jgi:CubicO group peptidase (beta-lactamase class C family)
MSKPIFALFTLKMIEQRIIDLDTPLYEYYQYPDIQGLHTSHPEAKTITARMVLSHTTGLPNWRFFNEDGKLNLLSKPGETYSYSGEGYEYLAAVLAHRLNLDYPGLNALIIKTIFKPLSMDSTSFMLLPELKAVKANAHEEGQANPDLSIGFASYFGAAYGLHSTGTDFANLLVELNQQTLLPKSLYEAYLTPTTAIPEDDSINNEFGYHSFGLGILIGDTPYGTKYAHGGMNPGFQGFFVVIPETQFGFAFFGNSDTAINMLPAIEACLVEGEC